MKPLHTALLILVAIGSLAALSAVKKNICCMNDMDEESMCTHVNDCSECTGACQVTEIDQTAADTEEATLDEEAE